MTYLLPPLNALRVFEAAARHLSFKLAAQELHVTAGAVAQQVKGLEARLGLRLFERLHRQLLLTPAGERYLGPLRDALRIIADATASLRPDGIGAVVTLGLPGGFDLARVEGARRQMAPFLLRVMQPAGRHELAEGKVDALVGRGRHPGYRSSPLGLDEVLLCPEGTADCPELTALRAALVTPGRSPRSPATRARRPSRRSSSSRSAGLRPARAAE